MMQMRRTKALILTSMTCAGSVLAGCGGDEAETAKPIERGVVTSALECADIYSIDIEKCQTAIRDAINAHESSATKYTRLHKCEAAEGPQRCERAGQKDFSRRLQAFLIGIKDPPLAAPLYPTTDQQAGFLRTDGSEILLDQDEIKFSERATFLAEANEALPKKPAGGGL